VYVQPCVSRQPISLIEKRNRLAYTRRGARASFFLFLAAVCVLLGDIATRMQPAARTLPLNGNGGCTPRHWVGRGAAACDVTAGSPGVTTEPPLLSLSSAATAVNQREQRVGHPAKCTRPIDARPYITTLATTRYTLRIC
jgi:hypothetical protein